MDSVLLLLRHVCRQNYIVRGTVYWWTINSFSTTLGAENTGDCRCLQTTISCVILYIYVYIFCFHWPNKRKKNYTGVYLDLCRLNMVQVRRRSGFDLGLCVCAYVECVVMVNKRHIKCGFCAKSIYLQTYLMTRDFFPPSEVIICGTYEFPKTCCRHTNTILR